MTSIPPAGRAWSGSATTGTSPWPASAQAPCASRRCPQAAGAGSNSTAVTRRCASRPGYCSTWAPPPRLWPPTGQPPRSRPPWAAASWSTWAVTSGWRGIRRTAAGRSVSPTTPASTPAPPASGPARWSWSATAAWPRRVRSAGPGGAAIRGCITSSTRSPAGPPGPAGAPSASPPRAASARTSPAPRRSCAASARSRWLDGLGLPARLVRQDGTVVTVAGWPGS